MQELSILQAEPPSVHNLSSVDLTAQQESTKQSSFSNRILTQVNKFNTRSYQHLKTEAQQSGPDYLDTKTFES